ncbi:hypothetical protein SARC_18001, partial [Sphaeroforma arctica JP610]
ADGSYAFNGIPLCEYTISVPEEVSATGGTKPIYEGHDNDDTKTEADVTIDLAQKDVIDVDFLYKVPAVISGTVTGYEDGEGIADVTVTVICTANTSIFYKVQTNADGTYVIDDVKDCDYTVSVPEAFNGEPIKGLSSKTVSITPADRTEEADFVYVPLGTISGYTLNDFDQSPLATVEVTLSCKGVDETRTTNTSGYYIFENLGDCNYTVTAPLSVTSDVFAGI